MGDADRKQKPADSGAMTHVASESESDYLPGRRSGMTGVVEERQHAAQEASFRMTGGAAGTPPMARIIAERQGAASEALRRVTIMRKSDGRVENKGRHKDEAPAANEETANADAKAEEAHVSEPGEPAEKEADAVADSIAERLHAGGGPADRKAIEPGKEQAPKIGAKLDPTKIHRAGKDPLKQSTKNALGEGPTVNSMRVGGAHGARVTKPPQHHVFPQNAKDKAWFAERSVDVDNYCVNLAQSDHELLHDINDWNRNVMTLLREAEKRKGKGQKLAVGEMLTAIQPLMVAAKIAGLPFVRYGSPRPDEGKK